MMRLRLCLLAILCGVATPALADFVVFHEGRYMKVEAAWFDGDFVRVELAGGARMSFGADRVKYLAPDDDIEGRTSPGGVTQPALANAEAGAEAWHAFADPRYVDAITRIAGSFDVDPALVAAIVKAESDFRPNAVSPKGAQGLMQLMPGTARQYKVVDPFDAESNLRGGVAHFARLLKRHKGEESLALATYNAGQVAVDKAGGIPPYPETERYVKKVLALAGRVN